MQTTPPVPSLPQPGAETVVPARVLKALQTVPLNTSSAVMSDPSVAEGRRFCSRCDEPVGRGRDDRIVQSSASPRFHFFQSCLQLGYIIREILIEIVLLSKIHYEHFVLRIARSNQIESRLIHRRSFRPHRSRIIDQKPQRHRHVLLIKRRDLLRLGVFVHPE